jgi:peptide/nickel transport system substrate-binding protein
MRLTQVLLFETLVQQDENLRIVPGLATSWEQPNPKTYVLELKRGVQFHSGAPFTAADVKFTFEHIMDAATKSPFQFLNTKLKEIEVRGDHTVVFHLHQPEAAFFLDTFIPIFSQTSDVESGVLIGTGPFELISQTPNEIRLRAFAEYHGTGPFVEEVAMKIIQDDNTRFLKMRKGEIDLAINVVPLDKLPQFERGALKREYRLESGPALSYQYLGLNMASPKLQDVRVRQALAHAINRDELILFLKKGRAVAADSVLTAQNDFAAAGLPSYGYDPERARQLLREAGVSNLTLEYKTSTSREAVQQARIIQNQLREVGVNIEIRSFEWGTFFSDVTAGNFELFSLRWVGVSEPDFYHSLFHSSQLPPQGRNRVRYSSPELDQLLEQGRSQMDREQRKATYFEVQQLLQAELPYISLWHNQNVALIKQGLQGFRLHPSGGFQSLNEVRR